MHTPPNVMYHENEQSPVACNNIDELHKLKVENPDIKTYDSIYIKFKNRQN